MPESYACVYLKEPLERVLAGAFLEWRLTWDYRENGASASWSAAKSILKKHKVKKAEVFLLFRMKNLWVTAETRRR